MPTSTSTIGWTLANVGPAPTTYPAAPSCTAASSLILDWQSLRESQWGISCGVSDDCWPKPTDSALEDEIKTNPAIVPFYSPGVACPTGWQAIGSIAHPTGPSARVTSSGYLSVYEYEDFTHGDWIYGYQIRDAFGVLLDPGETVIACCPSSFFVEEYLTGCVSAVPYTPSTGCETRWSERPVDISTTPVVINGTTSTVQLLMPLTSPLPTTTVETTFSNTENLLVLSQIGPIYLVHQPSDLEGKTSALATGGSDQDSTSNEAESTGTNAASALRVGHSQSGWGQIAGLAGVLILSLLSGMALVLPW
ncbi:uncharacterized protein BDW70DRAFT_145941 [Aspergillus foveolatus]|uniref:uncharacterized protein n=1 Tax=Aspergillus foveolatus TaxID=210207 RepID=UPI003CCD94B2